ncbi:unnamed protein product [Tetraodon nigroviridis]|uniref:(spotted green pufferfish) hypothetical protein n=1 Tax=Tetraodon nigroviridis TaxID=99883 RepID=Q4SLM3_TETNG|nr:unnamed protein product [Tetraodon nigroviridis]
MSQSMSSVSSRHSDKIAIRDFQVGDLVLIILDEIHDNYVLFTVGPTLYFLHSESLTALDLKPVVLRRCAALGTSRRPWVLGKVMEKEYCQAKKAQNRFKVPLGTKFYRGSPGGQQDPTDGRLGGQVTLSLRLAGNTKEGWAGSCRASECECARLVMAAVNGLEGEADRFLFCMKFSAMFYTPLDLNDLLEKTMKGADKAIVAKSFGKWKSSSLRSRTMEKPDEPSGERKEESLSKYTCADPQLGKKPVGKSASFPYFQSIRATVCFGSFFFFLLVSVLIITAVTCVVYLFICLFFFFVFLI